MKFYSDKVNSVDSSGVMVAERIGQKENVEFKGRYVVSCLEPLPEHRERYLKLRERIDDAQAQLKKYPAFGFYFSRVLAKAWLELAAIPKYEAWQQPIDNLVTTVGKNNMLDNQLAGSSYTAAWYGGLISATSYTSGPAAGDTSASHGGWAEDQYYSQSTRVAPSFSSASSGSKATASAMVYTMNASTTIKGLFLISVSTKGGTTGTLFSAGLFTGGDQAVTNSSTLNVTYTLSC